MAKKLLWASLILVALLFVGMVASYFVLFRVFNVPTGNMANTIVPGERVVCVMHVGEIKRGDIIVFKYPQDPKVSYLKRVIGLPNETVQLRGSSVLINGKELLEARTFVEIELDNQKRALREFASEGAGPYRVYYDHERRKAAEAFEAGNAKYGVKEPFQIPAGHYFVLGDCRDNSLDSRYWGPLSQDLILGKALMIMATEDPSRRGKLFQPLK